MGAPMISSAPAADPGTGRPEVLVIVDALDAFYLGAFLFGLLFSAVSHLVGFAQ